MLQQMQLKNIPQDLQFDYLRSFQCLMDIREYLDAFEPVSEADKEILKKKLADYRRYFKRISEINAQVVQKSR